MYDSLENDKWESITEYIDPLAEEGMRRRKEKGIGVFSDCGTIFVCKGTRAKKEEIESVITAGGGHVTRRKEGASMHVGEDMSESALYESVMRCELVRDVEGDEGESEEY